MNVEEIKQKKEVLTKNILDMIKDFEKETGVLVGIKHSRTTTETNQYSYTKHEINIKIEL